MGWAQKSVVVVVLLYVPPDTKSLCPEVCNRLRGEKRQWGGGGGLLPTFSFPGPGESAKLRTLHEKGVHRLASGGEGKKGAPLLWAPIISPSTAWSWTMFYIRMNRSRSCSFGTTSSPAKKGHLRLRRRPPHNFQSNSAPKNCLLTSLGRNQRI